MNRRLFWKLCLIIGTGVVALFYFVDLAVNYTEENMSFIKAEDRQTIRDWASMAESLYLNNDQQALEQWLQNLQQRHDTWAAVAKADVRKLAGGSSSDRSLEGYNMGRGLDWKIHLYFEDNPVMEVPFTEAGASFLIRLPTHMRPGTYWPPARIAIQVIVPMILLVLLSVVLYRHIMSPLKQLESAARKFSHGDFDIRVRQLLGNRDDELAQLADTFDKMAARIGQLIVSQRQLIADLSHELRTPLARLDIAIESLHNEPERETNLERIQRESKRIRTLVDDSLTLAWLDNEQPQLRQESLDLIDLIDVIVEDARFEFPDRKLRCELPGSALIHNSNHQAIGQALENALRNAMRYTPPSETVVLRLSKIDGNYRINIIDRGPGVPEQLLEKIFKPFFRVDNSRAATGTSFGLGLALAKRQLAAVNGEVFASNESEGGLNMTITLPAA